MGVENSENRPNLGTAPVRDGYGDAAGARAATFRYTEDGKDVERPLHFDADLHMYDSDGGWRMDRWTTKWEIDSNS